MNFSQVTCAGIIIVVIAVNNIIKMIDIGLSVGDPPVAVSSSACLLSAFYSLSLSFFFSFFFIN